MPATTNQSENPLDASQIVKLQEIVNNAVATTLSKVMGEEEEVASKKSNKSALSRLSKKSKAPSVAPQKFPLPDTIIEEEAVPKIEKAPTVKEEEEVNEKDKTEEISTLSEEREVAVETLVTTVELETISPASTLGNIVTEDTPKPGFFCFAC